MNDASQTQTADAIPVKRPIEVITYLRPKSLANPGAALADENGPSRVIVGTVVGYATGIRNSKVTDTETGEERRMKSILGSFEGIPADEKKPIYRSGSLQFPTALTADLVAALEKDADAGVIMIVSFDVGVMRQKNAAGYSWFIQHKQEVAADDPLLKLRENVLRGDKALPAPAPVSEAGQNSVQEKKPVSEPAKAGKK